jgi:N-acetylneuraminic acid mutarotase
MYFSVHIYVYLLIQNMKSILLIFILMGTNSHAQSYGWDSNVYLPGLGRDDAVCFTLDEIVFVGTGNHGGFWESNVFYAYNTRSGLFQDVAAFPGVARQYARVEEIGFKAYLIAGIDEFSNPLKDVWEYDLIEDKWTQKADFPGANRWKAASFVIDNIIYYGTGRDLNKSFNDFWKYDVFSDSWTQIGDIPFLPRDETIGFSVYSSGYIGLGIDCTGVLQSDIWKYDAFSNTWIMETDFPGGPRWYAISEVLNGHAFIGTGEDAAGNIYNDFWSYDPSTGQWEQAENLPNPARRGVAATSIQFKGIYFAGGLSDSFQRLTEISRYTNRSLNPPDLKVFYQYEEGNIYIYDIPQYTFIRLFDMRGKLMFETNERIDHLKVDASDWSKGVYFVWAANQSVKFIVR